MTALRGACAEDPALIPSFGDKVFGDKSRGAVGRAGRPADGAARKGPRLLRKIAGLLGVRVEVEELQSRGETVLRIAGRPPVRLAKGRLNATVSNTLEPQMDTDKHG